jgi:hypothetical protein
VILLAPPLPVIVPVRVGGNAPSALRIVTTPPAVTLPVSKITIEFEV